MEKANEVFIVVADYVKSDKGVMIQDKHIAAVYSEYDNADKLGKWLLEQEEYNGMKYINYTIENFVIL